jgi:hypothetical protein
MYLRLCSLGLVALAGCAGTTPDAKSTAGGRSYTISVPHMI